MRKLRLLLLVLSAAVSAQGKTVWIDTDPSIGSPVREVDDAYALLLALASPELRIAGVSTTYGNAPLARTTVIARELVRKFGPGLTSDRVYAGASSPADLGKSTVATRALAQALRGRGQITYLALGPLTNLATLLQLHPELARRFERVIFVGGETRPRALAFGPGQWIEIHDANAFKDPAAVKLLLKTKIPLQLTGIETGRRLTINPNDRATLARGGRGSRYLAQRSGTWLWFWRTILRQPGGPIFDALAVMAAIRPEALANETRFAQVDEAGHLLVRREKTASARAVQWCADFAPASKSWIVERLAREGPRNR